MNIDFWGVIYGCRAFIPHLRESDWGCIVNISSLFGLVGSQNQSAYNAAKFAVKGFSDSLRLEMDLQNYNIHVSSVHPGGIKTDIVNSARFGEQAGKQMSTDEFKQAFNNTMARTSPEQAAEIIMKGVKRKKARILVGTDAKVVDLISRLWPSMYHRLALWLAK